MSHSGVEPKPPWSTVPRTVRGAVEELLGTPVQRAMRVWGGYTPTPTYRLRLTDGRRAFFKAIDPSANDFARAAHAREERIYRELGDLIARWAPAWYGSCQCDGWHVLLLEDLGPKSVPPWTRAAVRGVARAYAEFHRATLGMALPAWLPQPKQHLLTEAQLWEGMVGVDGARPIAELAGDRAAEALRWFDAALPELVRSSRGLADLGRPYALLHGDTRSDNLRWVRGRLRLVDWPHVSVGPAEYDAAAFAQSVTAEGGPAPEQVIAWYGERAAVRPEVLDAAVAALAGFFADQAWRPDIPGLPRLRAFQRRQLAVTLAWAARRQRLPEPAWISGIAT
jgi:hypothetical protein